MCGMFGYIGPGPDRGTIAELAKLAGRRGPHACGWAALHGSTLGIRKQPGSLSQAASTVPAARIVLGHSRLATTAFGEHGNLRDAQPVTIPPGAMETSGPVLVHNGVADIPGVPLEGGCDSEALLRLYIEAGSLHAALDRLPEREPYAVILAESSRVIYARRGLPLFAATRPDGLYLCSVPFAGSAAVSEGIIQEVRL
jgi:asparagine synthetase B (glutamine-hydrolysing)